MLDKKVDFIFGDGLSIFLANFCAPMVARLLSLKEQKILESFSRLKPELVDTSQVSFGADTDMYTLAEPVVYKLPNTASYLVFGEIKRSMSLDQMKTWLEEQMRAKKTQDDENVIDGEAEHGETHDHACTHHEEVADAELNEDDIKLIMDQVSISREEAIGALEKANSDVVNALVELSKNK